MAYTDLVYINDTDINDLGLRVTDFGEWWSGPSYERGSAAPYGLMGSVPATEATVKPKALTLSMALPSATVAGRVAALDTVRHHLRGLLEVRFGDDSDRVAYGLLESDSTPARWPEVAFVTGDLAPRLQIVFYDVAKYDRGGSVVGFDSTRRQIPLGTAPSGGKIFIHNATDPVLRYRSASGTIEQSMTFTVTLASTEALEIDLGAMTVTKISSGTRTDALSTLTSGWFFHLDPADGDGGNSVYPTLETTTGTAEIRYRKRYVA